MSELDQSVGLYGGGYEREGLGNERARSRSPGRAGAYRDERADRGARYPQDRFTASHHAATAASRHSQKDCRVYVGNLGYNVKWNTLKDFMREAGDVKFSEVLTLPNGSSKGCGIVEYSSPDEAQRAIQTLSDRQLEGRQVFIREDREDQVRYGGGAGGTPFVRGGGRGGFASGAGRGGYGPPVRGGHFGAAPPAAYGGGGGYGSPTQLYVSNLPFEVSWQDLKDLFRAAGNVTRADTHTGPDGRPRGTGIVAFHNSNDASNAIAMYHGFDYRGRILEVRLDRFAGNAPPMDSYGGRGGFGRGPPPGSFGGRGGFAGRGNYGGEYGDSFGGASRGGYGGGAGYSSARPPAPPAAPSQQIFVKNLPWSTSNDDLVELFQTTATVQQAEVLFEHGRSKGSGIVQLATTHDAETAIAKFNHYVYGGRPLDIEFNRRWHPFGAAESNGAVPEEPSHYRTASEAVAPTDGIPGSSAPVYSAAYSEANADPTAST